MAGVHRGFAPTLAAAAVCAAALLAACASPKPDEKIPARGASAAAAPTDDWHALMIVPFGTLLRDVPYRLDEVVVFHDSAGAAAGREDH